MDKLKDRPEVGGHRAGARCRTAKVALIAGVTAT
jgi:hypothetical protein